MPHDAPSLQSLLPWPWNRVLSLPASFRLRVRSKVLGTYDFRMKAERGCYLCEKVFSYHYKPVAASYGIHSRISSVCQDILHSIVLGTTSREFDDGEEGEEEEKEEKRCWKREKIGKYGIRTLRKSLHSPLLRSAKPTHTYYLIYCTLEKFADYPVASFTSSSSLLHTQQSFPQSAVPTVCIVHLHKHITTQPSITTEKGNPLKNPDTSSCSASYIKSFSSTLHPTLIESEMMDLHLINKPEKASVNETPTGSKTTSEDGTKPETLPNLSLIDYAAERKLLRKLDLHVVPVIAFLYVLAFVDRINIGNARIQGLEKDLNMRGQDYNIALFVFFIPYILFEVPSNLLIRKFAPSTWLTSIMVLWGECSRCSCSSPLEKTDIRGRDCDGMPRCYSKFRWPGRLSLPPRPLRSRVFSR